VKNGSDKVDCATNLYAMALERIPSAGDHLRIPGSHRVTAGLNEAWRLIERAGLADAHDARVHAARGNLLLRGGFLELAHVAYKRAASLDPHDAPSRYALAELATVMGDEAAAQFWFNQAFTRRRLFSPPKLRAGSKHALVLGLAGPWPRNIPLDFVIADARWTLHRWFLPDPEYARCSIPRVDLIVNAFGDSVAGAAALANVKAILAMHAGAPSINAPERLRGLRRDRLAWTLADIPGVLVPEARRVTRATLAASGGDVDGLIYPLLVRPVDTHGGRGLERLQNPNELPAYLARARMPTCTIARPMSTTAARTACSARCA
jgi:hypothetical protein